MMGGGAKPVKAIGIQMKEGLGFGIGCMPVMPFVREKIQLRLRPAWARG